MRWGVLSWTPHAKQRPRTTFKDGYASTYTPKATRDAEKALAEQWDDDRIEGPIAVTIILADSYVKVTVEPVGGIESRKLKGDIDNYTKTVVDALNGVAWIDDRQIVQLTVRKT